MPDSVQLEDVSSTVAPSSIAVRPRRRLALPLVLFVLTCLSTFWVGASVEPLQYIERSQEVGSLLPIRSVILAQYRDGLLYMAALLAILFAHEMGHFVATVIYRIPASFPYFLPLPITPIGTLGAVISVDGRVADRKQIFDIGLAGPLAGLLVAVPLMCYAAQHLELRETNGYGSWELGMPLGIQLILHLFGPADVPQRSFWLGHLQGNPLFIAGWVGFLITGLNMIPISQLDGGHVAYCLFGRSTYWLARGILALVGFHVIWSLLWFREPSPWLVMALLVLVIGPYHPPTRDDSVPIGWFRATVGVFSLAIPFLCLPLQPLQPVRPGHDVSPPAGQLTARSCPLANVYAEDSMETPDGQTTNVDGECGPSGRQSPVGAQPVGQPVVRALIEGVHGQRGETWITVRVSRNVLPGMERRYHEVPSRGTVERPGRATTPTPGCVVGMVVGGSDRSFPCASGATAIARSGLLHRVVCRAS